MGNKIDILIKCIGLLFKEYELINKGDMERTELSVDLVKSILNVLSSDKKPLSGSDIIIVEELKNFLSTLIDKTFEFNRDTVLQTIEIILRDREQLYLIIEKSLNQEMSVSGSKNSIVNLRKYLLRYYKECEMVNLISKASFALNTSNVQDGVSVYVNTLIDKLQALNITTSVRDPAIQEMVDIDNEEEVEKSMEEMSKEENGGEKFKTGWKALNRMLQSGFRRGEQWVIGSLQHNYKSGFVRSLFVQLITHNKPLDTVPGKKPLALFISFEDQVMIINSFIYKYLYYNEFNDVPDFSKITAKEITKYITEKLTANGFKVMIMKVDPNLWDYKNLVNKVVELEANGYDPQILVVDYLSKMNTNGCKQGPIGTEYRDLFDKMRQFSIGHNILFITPHQLSTEAKALNSPSKGGLTGFEFLREINGKGYYADTRQLDQVVDGEIYIIKSRVARGEYKLYCARGKHRTTKIIANENDLEFSLDFPKNGMPIKEDLYDPDVEEGSGVKDEDFFL